jgi:uncharacterized protein YndB with AHSA1/START domain
MTGNRILGTLRSEGGRGAVRIEDRYGTDIDDLWAAITDPDRLARWYGRVEGDLRPGGEFRLHVDAAGLDAVGRVDVCEPPRRLRVTTRETEQSWQEGQGPLFDETAEATLTADGDQTVLVIEVRNLPPDKIAFYGAGWQEHAENLAAHLAGRERAAGGERFNELVPAYQEQAARLA